MTSKDSLGDVNNRLVAHGESFPVVTLKDGSKVQTGTIGALVQNIKLYDRIAAGEEIEGLTKSDLESMMELAIPTMKRVGFMDLFPVDEWLASKSDGRKFVGKKLNEVGH